MHIFLLLLRAISRDEFIFFYSLCTLNASLSFGVAAFIIGVSKT